MITKKLHGGLISWQLFDVLFEHHFDCLRKIHFFVKAGNALKEEGVVLEILAEFVKQKEHELEKLRQDALAERHEVGCFQMETISGDQESNLDPESIGQEDRRAFGKLREICIDGGEEWGKLKALTEAAYALLKNRQR